MKAITVAAAALAVFFLLLGMLASAPAAAPASGLDRCLMCHPQAHPSGWEQTFHIRDLETGEVSMNECARCHQASFCTDCHAKVQAAQQQGDSAPQQPGATTP